MTSQGEDRYRRGIVHVLAADEPVSVGDGARRHEPRDVHDPARHDEYADRCVRTVE